MGCANSSIDSTRMLYNVFSTLRADGDEQDLWFRCWEGPVAGVLYALIALGFVLIFKASGVFNFAQGIMVVFAALTLVGLQEMGVPAWLADRGARRHVLLAVAWSGSCCGRWSTSRTSSCSWRRSASPTSSSAFGEFIFGGRPKR